MLTHEDKHVLHTKQFFFIEKMLAQSNISGGQQLLLVPLGPRNPCVASEAVYERWRTEKDGHAISLNMTFSRLRRKYCS